MTKKILKMNKYNVNNEFWSKRTKTVTFIEDCTIIIIYCGTKKGEKYDTCHPSIQYGTTNTPRGNY